MAVSAGNFSFDQINSKEEAPMGKADAAVRNWLSDKRRFADLFNGVIFSGREVVTADELEEQKGETSVLIPDKAGGTRPVQMEYAEQVRLRNKQRRYQSSEEILSGFGRNDRLYPVITLVFYNLC